MSIMPDADFHDSDERSKWSERLALYARQYLYPLLRYKEHIPEELKNNDERLHRTTRHEGLEIATPDGYKRFLTYNAKIYVPLDEFPTRWAKALKMLCDKLADHSDENLGDIAHIVTPPKIMLQIVDDDLLYIRLWMVAA